MRNNIVVCSECGHQFLCPPQEHPNSVTILSLEALLKKIDHRLDEMNKTIKEIFAK